MQVYGCEKWHMRMYGNSPLSSATASFVPMQRAGTGNKNAGVYVAGKKKFHPGMLNLIVALTLMEGKCS